VYPKMSASMENFERSQEKKTYFVTLKKPIKHLQSMSGKLKK
jgi:hypothetical protein